MDQIRNSILIVDDEGSNIAVLGRLLAADYTTYAAIDGHSAIALARRHLPDLILLDIVMPGMNGYAVLSELKSIPETRDIPVIFVTGLESRKDEEKGLALDAADYIGKPFSELIVKLRVRNQMQIVNSKRTIERLTELAKESDSSKTRFLAGMSHELRTPISAILSISEVQLRDHAMSPQTEEAFGKVYDSSKILLKLVSDILDFSKIESGNMELEINEYNVTTLVSEAAQLHLAYVDRKDVTFKLHVDENLPAALIGDIMRVNHIISHLLTNAFKYTEEGSVSLTLSGERGEGERVNLIITISDTGIGMSKGRIKEIEDLNSEFVQLNEQAKNYMSGTGLGLPVVYSLVNMMGAKMTFESELGEGSTVVVNIPQRTTTLDILGEETARSLEKFESVTWNSSREFEFEPPQMPHGRVLVVDDVDSNLYVAEAMLESFGITVELCESAEEALEKIEAGNTYHMILMDHMMPGMDGMEATKILRERGYDLPIVALTAGSGQSQAQMFTKNGFSGFMSKPIEIYLLNSYLVRFVGENKEALK